MYPHKPFLLIQPKKYETKTHLYALPSLATAGERVPDLEGEWIEPDAPGPAENVITSQEQHWIDPLCVWHGVEYYA